MLTVVAVFVKQKISLCIPLKACVYGCCL